MVKGSELENRAETFRGQADSEAAIRRMRGKAEVVVDAAVKAADQEIEGLLAELNARIAQARVLPPPHSSQADGRSWAMGRDAVIAVLDGIA